MNDNYVIDADDDLAELDGPQPAADIFPTMRRKRKPKVSTVPTDYDPFDTLTAVPDGYQRPAQKCWVDKSIARPVSLSELSPLWRQDIETMGTSDRRHRFLASIVAMVDGDYHVRRRKNGLWVAKKKASEVKNILWNEWGGDATDLNIRKDTIDTFFSERSYLVLDQTIYVPGAGSFVEYKGKNCLNRHYEMQIAFPEDAMMTDETHQLIELIVKNLLNHNVGEFPDWTDAIFADEPSPIKWLFHWLASLYQRAGYAHSTVLWFIGPAQGIGKSLFSSGLAHLLGTSNLKVASSEEFKSEWSDFLMNASVFVMDEVDFSSRKDANSKLKRLVGNATIAVRKRNHGEIEIPAVASFVFTTNNVHPLAMDRDDRRNTFFETNGSAQAKKRARDFGQLGVDGRHKAWEGLAELLSLISIDDQLINTALVTDIKVRMLSAGLDPFDEWFHSDEVLHSWSDGQFAPVDWIKKSYTTWAKDNAFRGCATTAYCQAKLDEKVSEGAISSKLRKTLHDGSKPHGYVRIDPECDATITSAKDCEVIAVRSRRPNIAKVKNAILENRSSKPAPDDD